MNNPLGLNVVGSLRATHKTRCATFDPVPDHCDCGVKDELLVRLSDVKRILAGSTQASNGAKNEPSLTAPTNPAGRTIYQAMLVNQNYLDAPDAWMDVGEDYYNELSKRADMKTRIVRYVDDNAAEDAIKARAAGEACQALLDMGYEWADGQWRMAKESKQMTVVLRAVHYGQEVCDPDVLGTCHTFDALAHGTEVTFYSIPKLPPRRSAGMPAQQWLNELESMVSDMRTSGGDVNKIMAHAKQRIVGE